MDQLSAEYGMAAGRLGNRGGLVLVNEFLGQQAGLIARAVHEARDEKLDVASIEPPKLTTTHLLAALALCELSPGEIKAMPGYKKIQQACANLDVKVEVGNNNGCAIIISVAEPYAASKTELKSRSRQALPAPVPA